MFEFKEESAMETGAIGGYLETGVHKFSELTISKTVASTGTVGFDISMQIEGQKYRTIIYGVSHIVKMELRSLTGKQSNVLWD